MYRDSVFSTQYICTEKLYCLKRYINLQLNISISFVVKKQGIQRGVTSQILLWCPNVGTISSIFNSYLHGILFFINFILITCIRRGLVGKGGYVWRV